MRIPPELALRRIRSRNRPGEEHIAIDYSTILVELYDDWMMDEKRFPVHIIDATQPIKVVRANVQRILNMQKLPVNQPHQS